MKKKFAFLAIILLVLSFLVYFAFLKRVHRISEKRILLSTGEVITVTLDYSSSPIIYAAHDFLIGNYFPKFQIRFNYKGSIYVWETKSSTEPIILNVSEGVFYLAKIDINLDCYQYKKEWEKINTQNFPKAIAVQNIFYYASNKIRESTIGMNPDDNTFRWECVTPKLWLCIEKGIEPQFNSETNRDFIVYYKKKYLGLSEYEVYSKLLMTH